MKNLYQFDDAKVWLEGGAVYVQHKAPDSIKHRLTMSASSILEVGQWGNVYDVVYLNTINKVLHTNVISTGSVFIQSPIKELRNELRRAERV
jgi:hypothetical protein